MPAELVWSCEEFGPAPCYLVRGYGELFHVVEDGGPCPHADIPLKTLVVDGNEGRYYEPEAVMRDGKRVILSGAQINGVRNLTLFDTNSRSRVSCGHLGYDDRLGTEVCEASNSKLYVMAALVGLSIIEIENGTAKQQDEVGPKEGFESADPQTPYWDGRAKSISTYGDMLAIGGFMSDRVEVLDLAGKLQRAIGPRFRFQGTECSFARGDVHSLSPFGGEGVCVDRWQRIWVASDPGQVCVFSSEGECLYISTEDEFFFEDGWNAGFHLPWGVDSRGWLWCHGGRTAFRIPELAPSGLEPSLSSQQEKTGFEPSIGGG